MEKVIHEFKVIETEDGFRIEIKGDKEALKQMGFGQGMMPPMMPFMMGRWMRGFRGHGPWGGHHRHGHGPFGGGWGDEGSQADA